MKQTFTILLALLALPVITRAEPVKLTIDKDGDAEILRLENYRVALVITPSRGGQVTAYKDKLQPFDKILQSKYHSLCLDHFQEQRWPGEFPEQPYTYEVLKQTPEEVQIVVRCTATGLWPKTAKPDEKLTGVLLEKTYTLRAESPALTCSVRLTAPEDAAKTFAYWIQSVFWVGGSYDPATDRSYRPTVRGVRNSGREDNPMVGREDWLRDFSACWHAIVDTKTQTGLAFLGNYDDLKVLYANAGNASSEFMYSPVSLPAGKSCEYTIHILPIVGMAQVTHVDEHAIIGAALTSDNEGNGSITLKAARSVLAPTAVTVDAGLYGATDKRETTIGQMSLPLLKDQPQETSLTFSDGPGDPLVLRLRAKAGEHTAAFEDFFPGAYEWGENLTTDMKNPVYKAERPEQKLTLIKPEKLAIKQPWVHRYLAFYGGWDDRYRLAEAMSLLSRVRQIDVSYYEYNSLFFGSLSMFPYDYDELLSYPCIVFGGVSKSGLRPIGVEMLHDYLMAGGGMVVLGSFGAYGRSHLRGTKLADAWPVEWPDTIATLQNIGGKKVTYGPDLPPFHDFSMISGDSLCYYLHQATAKPEAKVYLECDGKPFMVGWEYGPNKARIVCILGAPLGDPEKGDTPFWQDTNWYWMLRNAILWAGCKDRELGIYKGR